MSDNIIPVITIDGLGGSGKGTIGQLLAQQLDWHYLDSGSLYRVLALAAQQQQLAYDDIEQLTQLAANLPVKFKPTDGVEQAATVLLNECDVTTIIRSENCGQIASQISVIASVRQALVNTQRNFRQLPGLVTDGRDMGTVIFPDATLKIFLIASAEIRAQRRYEQLKQRGIHANLHAILTDLVERDERDRHRAVAPTIPAPDAIIIDTTQFSVADVLSQIMAHYQRQL